MITKRVLIELIQNRLAGGDTPADILGKYPYQVIERLLGAVFSDVIYSNRKAARDMAVSYSATVISSNNERYVILPVTPVGGTYGVVWVSYKGQSIPVNQGHEQYMMMQNLLPMVSLSVKNIRGNKMYLNVSPGSGDLGLTSGGAVIDISIIPDIISLADSDNVCVRGAETQIITMVTQLMRQGSSPAEEVYNNRVPDTDKQTSPAK